MDADRIGQLFARTFELRSKIANCIGKTNSNVGKECVKLEFDGDGNQGYDGEEAKSLLSIRDALESLEGQLSALQALQQQQWYDKEAVLSEIEFSQKKLLKALKEYEGKEIEIIQEAISFASETEDNNDLLLPPYLNRHSHFINSDNPNHLSSSSAGKISQYETILGGSKSVINVSQRRPESRGPIRGFKFLMSEVAKTAITIVGVITILSLTGFEPTLTKRNGGFKFSNLFLPLRKNGMVTTAECPPGKVIVIENGESRSVVKERVEIPFESVVATPDVNYGCG